MKQPRWLQNGSDDLEQCGSCELVVNIIQRDYTSFAETVYLPVLYVECILYTYALKHINNTGYCRAMLYKKSACVAKTSSVQEGHKILESSVT